MVSTAITVDGYQPWWWVQEALLWGALVPYTRVSALLQAGGLPETATASLPPDVARVVAQLRVRAEGAAEPAAGGALASPRPSAAARVAQAALWVETLAAVAWSRLTRRDTVLYALDVVSPGLDHDFRLSTIYRELRARGYRFAELVHVADLRRALRNLPARRRPVVLMEPWVEAYWAAFGRRAAHPRAVAVGEERDAPALAAFAALGLAWAAQAAQKYRALLLLLRLLGSRRAVVLDDSRHSHEVVAACRTLGVPTLGYMHGLFNRYHAGLMAYGFDGARRHTLTPYGVWSEYFRRRLLEGDLYRDDEVVVSGPLRPPAEAELAAVARSRRADPRPVRVLLLSEPRAAQEEISQYVARLSADDRFEVLLKLRPGETWPGLGEALPPGTRRPRLVSTRTVYEAFREADVVVGSYATVLYEASLALVPTVVLKTSFAYGHDLAADGLAGWAGSPDEVADAVLAALSLGPAELRRRRDALWGPELRDGATALFDLAETRLWPPPGAGAGPAR